MTITPEAIDLLEEVLGALHFPIAGEFPNVVEFSLAHGKQRKLIDELVEQGYLKPEHDRYVLTLSGLMECRSALARSTVDAFNSVLPRLKEAYRKQPGHLWDIAELAAEVAIPAPELARTLATFIELPIKRAWGIDALGRVGTIQLDQSVLDVEPLEWPEQDDLDGARETETLRVERVELTGYRPFAEFSARLGDLTVIIGANASGKSSLFDFLRFVCFAASNPLPPEIDPRAVGRRLFHANRPERIEFALVVDSGSAAPLRYEAQIQGPVGAPRVVGEQLATIDPMPTDESVPFVFLSFKNGRGVVRDPVERKLKRPEWTVLPNELALRRALDPTLVTLAGFQSFVAAWRFYSGFDVSPNAAMRRPAPSEPSPTLNEDGSNLSAVLFSLLSEHPADWEELEVVLRSAIPGFTSLAVKPRGGPGTVMGVWREQGVKDELTLADLSDGTLRLLCWATLCLSPKIPPLICLDEPELGLHPRVLPVLAGVLRLASARSQILVATHSPYFLSQFQLDEIAVMTKEDGRAVFKRPASSAALRQEVEELGSDALALMHISDELEARS